jgi:hypothetical protein
MDETELSTVSCRGVVSNAPWTSEELTSRRNGCFAELAETR